MIHAGAVQLPQFQRSFNWGRGARLEFLDSVQHDYPVGTLLFLEVAEKGSPFGSRLFEQVTASKMPKPKYLVLDGQQRLSTCYWALSSAVSASDRVLALKLRELFERTDGKPNVPINFSEILVSRKSGDNAVQMLYSKHLLPLPFLTDKVSLAERLHDYREQLAKDASSAEYSTFISKYVMGYLDTFFEYEFPCVVLPSSLDLEAVCVVFTKLNTTGLRLSAFDLCVATMYPHDIHLRDMLDIAHKSAAVRSVDSDGTNILQAVALLAGVSPKKAGLPKYLKPEHIVGSWSSAVSGLADAADRLAELGIVGQAAVPYDAVIPALGTVLAKVPYKAANAKQKERIRNGVARWVYQTALANRYNEGTDVKQAADTPVVDGWLNGGDVPAFLSEPVVWSSSIIKTGRSGARSKAFIAAINDNRPTDFMSGQNVGRGEGRVQSDLHHVFARAYLQSAHHGEVESDLVLNLTFLVPQTNVFMSDDAPSVYLAKMIERRAGDQKVSKATARDQVKAILATHLIDVAGFDAMMADDYDAFLEARAASARKRLQDSYSVPIVDATELESDEPEEVPAADETPYENSD
jgi:hypothetical protein